MVSVSMLAMVIWGVVSQRDQLKSTIRTIASRPEIVGLSMVFFVVLASGIHSTDSDQWLHEVKIKLPFLILPFAIFLLRPISAAQHRWMHQILIGTVVISSFAVLTAYLGDADDLQRRIGMGQSIPTPIDHIHYSIIMAYAAVTSFLLAVHSKIQRLRVVHTIGGLYLFAFLHFLSVRSGIVICYAAIGVSILWYIVAYRRYWSGLALMVSLATLPFVAYQVVPSFKQKIDYMRWDIQQYREGNGNNYSDAERLMSYEIAIDMIHEAPMFGHGMGDLRKITTELQRTKFGQKDKYIYPHNQYLFVCSGVGLIGGLLFFGGLLTPLVFARRRSVYLLAIYTMLLLSFLVENTIQRAVITAFFLFFILINYYRSEDSSIEEA